jgi:hypothetical protein
MFNKEFQYGSHAKYLELLLTAHLECGTEIDDKASKYSVQGY